MPTEAGEMTSLFASRDDSGKRLLLMALNFEPNHEARVRITLDGCTGKLAPGRTLTYQGGPAGFVERKPGRLAEGVLEDVLPPYAINVIELSAR